MISELLENHELKNTDSETYTIEGIDYNVEFSIYLDLNVNEDFRYTLLEEAYDISTDKLEKELAHLAKTRKAIRIVLDERKQRWSSFIDKE